jgi:transcriptional regulator with XRE-family HTH domain
MRKNFSRPLTSWRGQSILIHVKTELGQIVRDARLRQGLTLRELAERTSIPLRTVHAIELGDSRQPKAKTLRTLAAALGLPYGGLALAAYEANGWGSTASPEQTTRHAVGAP